MMLDEQLALLKEMRAWRIIMGICCNDWLEHDRMSDDGCPNHPED